MSSTNFTLNETGDINLVHYPSGLLIILDDYVGDIVHDGGVTVTLGATVTGNITATGDVDIQDGGEVTGTVTAGGSFVDNRGLVKKVDELLDDIGMHGSLEKNRAHPCYTAIGIRTVSKHLTEILGSL